MYRKALPAKQLAAWAFVAMVPTAIATFGGGSWLWVLVVAVVSLILGRSVWRWGTVSRLFAPLQIIFLVMVIGELSKGAAASWPGESYPAVPLMLIALAAWSAWKGASAAARVGTVLYWLVLIVYTAVGLSAVKEVEAAWLLPRWAYKDDAGALILLTPALALPLLKDGTRWQGRIHLAMAFVVAASLLTVGILSPGVASQLEAPFYQTTKGLELGGVVKHFEAVISAATTVGWFSLISLYLAVCGCLCETLSEGWGRKGTLLCAAAAATWLLYGSHISGMFLAMLAAVFWVWVPISTQLVERRKKM